MTPDIAAAILAVLTALAALVTAIAAHSVASKAADQVQAQSQVLTTSHRLATLETKLDETQRNLQVIQYAHDVEMVAKRQAMKKPDDPGTAGSMARIKP